MGYSTIGFFSVWILCLCMIHGEPQPPLVAFMCNKPTMYMSDNGWVEDRTTDCIEDPERILKYCQKVYPGKEITNVVESNELVTIDNWCRFDKPKCHHHNSHTVRPYRCLVGPFQSDALLVPEHCLFDHKHGTKCAHHAEWNQTAISACEGHKMKLQSFAMLQPCGTNIFNGVEFVCCPRQNSQQPTTRPKINVKPITNHKIKEAHPFIAEDDSNLLNVANNDKIIHKKPVVDQHKAVIADNDPKDWKPAPPQPKKLDKPNEVFYEHYIQKSKDDSYLNEHEYFYKAKNDLQKHHHDRVTKMMKEWADARQKVTDMKKEDPKGAEKLNKEITARFQKTYEALEQEGMADKKQLIAIHQQRVTADLNDKKRSAMEHYMDTLTDSKTDASKILKALKHYIKTEEKDKLHALNHFKHLMDTDPEEHAHLKQQTQAHLDIIKKRVDAAIDMLKRVPDFEKKVRQQIEEYLATFRELDNAIRATLSQPIPAKPHTEVDTNEVKPEPVKTEPKQQWEEIKKPVVEKKPAASAENEIYHQKSDSEINDEDGENEHYIPEMKVAHADGLRNDEMQVQLTQHKQNSKKLSDYSSTASVIIAVAAIAVFVIIVAGILVLRKRSQKAARGFVEVDQAASPEERHVANMQMNGYENPTYRYFETQQPA